MAERKSAGAWLRRLWTWFAGLFSAAVILLALAIGLFRLLLPSLPQYHDRIEAFASEAAGTPVHIGNVDARWRFSGPQLVFSDAQLYTADDSQVLLRARSGSVGISLPALLQGAIRPERIVLEGVDLNVERGDDGVWRLAGMPLRFGQRNLPPRVTLGLSEARVVLHDRVRGIGPLEFAGAELDLELASRRLRVEGSTRLPASLGRRLDVSVEAVGRLGEPQRLRWQVFAEGQGLDYASWAALVPGGVEAPLAGRGSLTLWGGFEGGRLDQASVYVDAADAVVAGPGGAAQAYAAIRGRFEWDRTATGWRAAAFGLDLAADGAHWPDGRIRLEHAATDEGERYEVSADFLRLDDLVPLAASLPPSRARDVVLSLAPRGDVSGVSGRLATAGGEITDYALELGFSRLGFDSHDRLPAADGLTGELRADAGGGRLDLRAEALSLHAPRILRGPVPADELAGVVLWRRGPAGWRVLSDVLELESEALTARASFELTLPAAGGSPLLDLYAQVRDGDVAAVRPHLPAPVIPPQVMDWLDDALVGGFVPAASINFRGPLAAFPFDGGEGRFRAVMEVENGILQYAPGWPAVRDVEGVVIFDNASLESAVRSASLAGNPVGEGQVRVADLRRGVVEVTGGGRTRLDGVFAYLGATPLAERFGTLLDRLRTDGETDVAVDLTLPVRDLDQREVEVTLATEGATVGLDGLPHAFQALGGTLRYTDAGLFAEGIRARLLDGPVRIDMRPEPGGGRFGEVATLTEVAGEATPATLARLDEGLADLVGGAAAWRAVLRTPAAGSEEAPSLGIASSLEGMSVALPAPLSKAAGEARELAVDIALPAGGAVGVAVAYGNVARARLELLPGEPRWRVGRSALHFGTTPPQLGVDPGLVLTGVVEQLDPTEWTAAGGAVSAAIEPPTLLTADLVVRRCDVLGQVLEDVSLQIQPNALEWLVQVESEAVAGALFVPRGSARGDPIVVNLERLHLVSVEGGDAAPADPRELPAVEVEVDEFRFGEMRFGRLEASFVSADDGLQLERFATSAPSFRVEGSGYWSAAEAGQQTRLQFLVSSTDLQATLESLAFEPSVSSPDATLEASLAWPGPPGPQLFNRLSGQVQLQIGAGQLYAVSPGAGRVFGLFSVTAIPRRLALDFRDVFEKGLGFDRIGGDFSLKDGNAYTSNLVLEGPAAQVGIVGRAGLVSRDYDQTAVVYGNFGAALPVAGAIAGGPVGGAAMLIFSEIFKKPLQQASRINYRITGSWDEPQVVRVVAESERTSGGSG